MLLMFIKKLLGRPSEQRLSVTTETLEDKVQAIQKGNLELRNELIHQYQPYVLKVVNKVCKRYIDRTRDDEFSIGLLAFNEAIDAYRYQSHPSFLAFSETVIRRRLIDYFRKEMKFDMQVPMSGFDVLNEDEDIYNPVEVKMAIDAHDNDRVTAERRSEIEQYSLLLQQYGMTMGDLVDVSPKHSDTREMLIGVSIIIAENEALAAQVVDSKKLPLKDLEPLVGVSRKTLERNRKYIIALALIRIHAFTYLSEYIKMPLSEKGEKR